MPLVFNVREGVTSFELVEKKGFGLLLFAGLVLFLVGFACYVVFDFQCNQFIPFCTALHQWFIGILGLFLFYLTGFWLVRRRLIVFDENKNVFIIKNGDFSKEFTFGVVRDFRFEVINTGKKVKVGKDGFEKTVFLLRASFFGFGGQLIEVFPPNSDYVGMLKFFDFLKSKFRHVSVISTDLSNNKSVEVSEKDMFFLKQQF